MGVDWLAVAGLTTLVRLVAQCLARWLLRAVLD
jgi:hypothetical protein